MKYTLKARYSPDVHRTPRVLQVGEMFGLVLDTKDFVVLDNLELEVRQGDVVYITGESGSGKSTILRELADHMRHNEGLAVEMLDEIELPEEPIIELIGSDFHEAMTLLAKAGINDANLYIRTPSQISDGQRYRLKLAKLIESGADVWVADEFLAVLDRHSALAIASNMQRIAREVGATLIVATTHSDMVADLQPSLIVEKRYQDKVKVTVPEGFRETT
jgi:ABC-type ATPase with predicted acetyltransferase domain